MSTLTIGATRLIGKQQTAARVFSLCDVLTCHSETTIGVS